MDKNYIQFVIAYDFGSIFDRMELACDEAYDLAEEITNRYIKYTEELGIEQYYETLYEYCESIFFEEVWNQMHGRLTIYRVGFNGNDETEVHAASEDEAIDLAGMVADESGVDFDLNYVTVCGTVED